MVLIDFPTTEGAQGKPRPALVILDSGDDDIVIARVTTHSPRSVYDVVLAECSAANLRAPSHVRLDKIATMAKRKVRNVIGQLSVADRQAISAKLKSMFGNW
jgi:mRNA interferase MazF